MPHIIVTADRADGRGDGAVMLMERINVSDFESDHFASQLVERLGWAVADAHEAERDGDDGPTAEAGFVHPDEDRDSANVLTTAS